MRISHGFLLELVRRINVKATRKESGFNTEGTDNMERILYFEPSGPFEFNIFSPRSPRQSLRSPRSSERLIEKSERGEHGGD